MRLPTTSFHLNLCNFVVVQSLICVQLSVTPWTAAHQASMSPPSPEVCSNSCPLSRWCHPTISFSVTPFSSCLQSVPASGSFLMSWLFISGGQSIGASASALALPMNIQDWFPLGWTGLISLQSKGLSRVISNTTFQKYHSLTLSFLYSPTLTSIHDYWKNHSFDRAPDLGLIEVTDWGPGIGTSTCPCAGQAWMTDCQGALGAELLCL